MDIAYSDLKDTVPDQRMDRWLRFDPTIESAYQAAIGPRRLAEMRHAILFGLVFFEVYAFTDWWLLPDIRPLIIAVRFVLMPPVAIAIYFTVSRTEYVWRERLTLWGMIGATLSLMTLFLATRSPFAPYVFGDVTICIVFANMNIPLSFRNAVIFSMAVFLAEISAMLLKADLNVHLRLTLDAQFATSIAFTLYANFHAERRRRIDYLAARSAQLRSEEAERNAARLTDLSETDILSGLPNRRHLERRLEEWLREPGPIALAMIDVDHFKSYNDSLGHPAGDECLRAIGGALKAFAEGGDTVAARYGGEEFTVAARGADEMEARRLALRIVKAVRALEMPHPGRTDGVAIVTVSVGVSLSAVGRKALKAELFGEADGALYEAKRRGRNRYVFAEALARSAREATR